VTVELFSSRSEHSWWLEQEGNRLQGSHKGEFSVRDAFGTIEGAEVRLQSTERTPGDQIPFTFAGKVAGETLAGTVYMGEYLTARFTARRHAYPAQRPSIQIPGGPPLAN
jgi:hypothetical protein